MKRDDLQAIRGVAILLVLCFHFQPSLFPLGFVGVDMFFVLSGFLMALILSKDSFSPSVLKKFYLRRFKRIVPLMYTILLFVYTGCSFLLVEMDKDDLKTDLRWSLTFTSNVQPLYEIKGYWDQVSSYRFLVHCWSLGVEIQFYFFAPFIISSTNLLSPFLRKLILSILILTSLTFQLVTPPKVSYGLLPSRIWQFLLGCLCFEQPTQHISQEVEMEKLLDEVESGDEKDESVLKKKKCSIFCWTGEILLTVVCFIVIGNWNPPFSEKVLRLFGTFSVAILIRWPLEPSKSVIGNRFLVYVGDISYVMYLVHWPIIVATKYILEVEVLDAKTTFIMFIVIFLTSVVLHHTLEKFLLSASLTVAFIITIFCFLFIYTTFPYYNDCCSLGTTENSKINITEAIAWNTYESKKVYYQLPCSQDKETQYWTNYTEEPQLRCVARGNGNLTIVVIGNSMAYRSYPLIKQVMEGKYKELRLYSRSSRPPLSDVDMKFTNAAHIVIDKLRPDVIWNVHVDERPEFISPFVNKTSDPMFLTLQKNLDFYKNRTKLFVIDLPFYWSPRRVAYDIVKRLKAGKSIDDFQLPKSEAIKQQEDHRKRLLALECNNCYFNNVEKEMYEGQTMWLYNRKNYHAYTGDGHHFTPEMLQKLTPLFKRAVKDILERLGKSNK